MNTDERENLDIVDLYEKVKEAFTSGDFDISCCDIIENFNLANLVLAYKNNVSEEDLEKWLKQDNFTFLLQEQRRDTKISFKMNASDTTFQGKVFLNGLVFQEYADFRDSTFNKEVYCCGSIFQMGANFWGSFFKEGISFNGSIFQGATTFWLSFFLGEADFSCTTFKKKADFKGSTFKKGANFGWSTFQRKVDFKEIKLHNKSTVKFDHITTYDYIEIIPNVLNGEIIIKDPTLESDRRSLVLDFKDCYKNKGKAIFEGVEVDHGSTCLKVRNLKEDSNVKVHFEDCGFYGKNVAFTDVYMQQVSITGGNYVAGMSFYHCEWAKEPAFAGLEFRAFNGLDTTDVPKIVESYGNLKVSALDAGDAQLSNDFHFWHQWHQWENLYQKRLWNWNNFYRITSAYGMSVRLPLFWFLFTFLILWLPYNLLLMGHIISEKPLLVCCEALPYWSPLEGLFVSGSASIPFIFSDSELIKSLMPKNTTHWQTLVFYGLYIVQHLIQGYLLFQIGAAIRNKVKR